ncbi:hypothetical protein MPTK1_6g02500 [Marchantia polymorpha subsp. ruderalis]|uniref:Sugar phosphate transporter domain-containing protein n=2 Tax=Marchantia polymorpha TaxID=3197 RepID=A0AAF6BMS8_MARPO|nr:hypothetical protein MARPO_0035s0035 [Marchantia polymorpha]BBN13312.1 hypothetical protein Mp_6g02500 [Marchantia polymorpha subsp. ruderalis]|eukprot:PTQ41240.1 hypothetical protein MARPO_0035s0035 [Marchantia polymorpha]
MNVFIDNSEGLKLFSTFSVPRDAAEHSSFLGIVPLERTVPHKKALISSSISPTTSFFKALLYSFMWCILSHSFLLFSTTGMGVTMATFPAPFLRITVHFIIQTILASCMLRWPMKRIISMSWTTFLWRVFPVAVAATVDHEPQATPFSNVCENLKVPVANILACKCEGPFNDMRNIFREKALLAVCRVQSKCKACVPLIVVVLTTIFKLDEHSHSAFCNIVTISVGFMIAVYKEEEVENWSLTESSLGSAISAFRLAATQNLLQNREIGLVSPVVTMRALAPAMALVTAVSSYFVDPWRTLHMTEFFNTTEHTLKTWAHIVVGAFLETSVALSELVVIYHSSANAMIIVVMFKEVALLTVSRFHYQNYTRLNAIGLGVFYSGVLYYTWLKYRKVVKRLKSQEAFHPPVPSGEGSSSSVGRSCIVPTDILSRSGSRIWAAGSSCVDRLLRLDGGLRNVVGICGDRFSSLFRRFA